MLALRGKLGHWVDMVLQHAFGRKSPLNDTSTPLAMHGQFNTLSDFVKHNCD